LQEINEKNARKEFCGPNKRIPREVMEELDQNIEKAKKTGNGFLIRKLKLR
jgi:hypothetical protein